MSPAKPVPSIFVKSSSCRFPIPVNAISAQIPVHKISNSARIPVKLLFAVFINIYNKLGERRKNLSGQDEILKYPQTATESILSSATAVSHSRGTAPVCWCRSRNNF